jgi:ketosteroid isomerase-like protein
MSLDNVKLYRQLTEAFNSPDGVPESLLTSDFCFENIVTPVADKTYHGAAGCLEWVRDMSDAYGQGARLELEKVIADRDDFVVARHAFVGTGARSGAPLRLRWVTVAWFQSGKLARSVGYANRHDALKAVGLAD